MEPISHVAARSDVIPRRNTSACHILRAEPAGSRTGPTPTPAQATTNATQLQHEGMGRRRTLPTTAPQGAVKPRAPPPGLLATHILSPRVPTDRDSRAGLTATDSCKQAGRVGHAFPLQACAAIRLDPTPSPNAASQPPPPHPTHLHFPCPCMAHPTGSPAYSPTARTGAYPIRLPDPESLTWCLLRRVFSLSEGGFESFTGELRGERARASGLIDWHRLPEPMKHAISHAGMIKIRTTDKVLHVSIPFGRQWQGSSPPLSSKIARVSSQCGALSCFSQLNGTHTLEDIL